ncbi:MAG: threonyl-tRNA synthetase editing domain-containing protein [Patescibacteria group bacterium]
MKTLLLSCKNFGSKIKKLATRPETVKPEVMKQKEYVAEKSIVVLINVEIGDNIKDLSGKLADEIRIFSKDTNIKTIVLYPFGHLSNKLASSEDTVEFLNLLEKELADFETIRVHFGSHKSLLLDIHGHKGNVRFREF